MGLSRGDRVGRYEILGPLGRGGMGEVYRARDPRLGRQVALKIIGPPQTTADQVERFWREARAALLLSHPNIASLWELGVDDDGIYAVFEAFEGESLRDRLARGPLPPGRALSYATQLAQALAAAHRQGIYHRDIKPSNIFITADGLVKLLDFGLARLESTGSPAPELTSAGIVTGTVAYSAPEQVRGEPVDQRTDIFALGAVLYEMLTGARAFGGSSPVETMVAVLKEDPVNPRILSPALPPELADAVVRCLAKDKNARFQTADELALQLRRLEEDETRGGSPPSSGPAYGPLLALPGLVAGGARRFWTWLRRPRGGRVPGDAVRERIGDGLRPCEPDHDPVDATVFAPSSGARGQTIFVQVFVHKPDQTEATKRTARAFDEASRRLAFKSLAVCVKPGTRLDVELDLPGLVVDEPWQCVIWDGRPQSVQFGVRIPADARRGAVVGTVRVSLESVPVGHIKFKLDVLDTAGEAAKPRPAGDEVRRYELAFISYASTDRNEVLNRLQMLELLHIRYFQDLLELSPGDRWEKKLYLYIDRCDLFLLFWSSAAKASEWVLKEVRYALARKADDDLAPPEILPVIIEGPPPVPPPPDFAHLHFDDRLTYFKWRGAAPPRGAAPGGPT